MLGPYESLQTVDTGRLRHQELLQEAKKAQMLSQRPRRRMGREWRRLADRLGFGRLLWLYMMLVLLHWTEHLLQVYQVYIMGWLPTEAGGLLGLWLPQLNASEVLHLSYNLLMWSGIVLLIHGLAPRGQRWWRLALALQSWHLLEHVLLQWQWLTGIYFFGAARQMGIGELLLPRVELHFLYNLMVVIPLVIGLAAHRATQKSEQTAWGASSTQPMEAADEMIGAMVGQEECHALPNP